MKQIQLQEVTFPFSRLMLALKTLDFFPREITKYIEINPFSLHLKIKTKMEKLKLNKSAHSLFIEKKIIQDISGFNTTFVTA